MKNHLIKLFYFYLFIPFSFAGFAQIDSNKDQEFFNFIYNFQFSKADSLISTIDSAERSSHYNFLKSHYMRWYYLPIHQQSEDILSRYSQYLESTDVESLDSDLNYVSVNNALLKAEFNYNQANYYKAFQNGAIVYEMLKDSLESRPNRIEIRFLAGLYHYYYQYYKAENPLFGGMMWLFQDGEKEKGLQWLKEVAVTNSLASTEALVYLAHIYLRLENEADSSLVYVKQLNKAYPNNLKFYELYIEAHLAAGKLTEEVKIQIQHLRRSDKVYFQKYGTTYYTLYQAQLDSVSIEKKLALIKDAKDFLGSHGTGDHLMSLLLFQQNLIEPAKSVLDDALEFMVYRYGLTTSR